MEMDTLPQLCLSLLSPMEWVPPCHSLHDSNPLAFYLDDAIIGSKGGLESAGGIRNCLFAGCTIG